MLGPECATFSPAREKPLGEACKARPLCSIQEPYGLSGPDPPFSEAEKKQLKLHNYFAVQSANLCMLLHEHNIPFVLEPLFSSFSQQEKY